MIYFLSNSLFQEFPTCTIEECVDYLSKQEVIGIDIETSRKYPKGTYNESVYIPGLDPYVTRVVMLQVGTLERQYVIDTRVVDISKLREVIESNETVKNTNHKTKIYTVGFTNNFAGNVILLKLMKNHS